METPNASQLSPDHQARVESDAQIQVSFISTGTVKIRPTMRSQPITNHSVTMRRLRSFADRGWTETMPIGAFLISHPAGPILFDTGESPHRNDRGFLPWWSPTLLLNTVSISQNEGIVSQLRARGVEPSTLHAVVLSHLHGDHAGGLPDLAAAAPDVPIYVSKEQWDTFGNSPLQAKIQGCCPDHWPPGFKPRVIERTDDPIGPWKQSSKLTRDGKIVIVDTPGHMPGHVSLVVRSDEGEHGTTYFLVGDATYGLDLLDKEEPDGINDDPETALRSLRMIKQFARETDLVVLPSHDPAVEELLRDRVAYKPKDSA